MEMNFVSTLHTPYKNFKEYFLVILAKGKEHEEHLLRTSAMYVILLCQNLHILNALISLISF